jgi:hypothetical protein
MLHRFLVLPAAVCLPVFVPSLAIAQQPERPLYTFVAEWNVPRAQWAEFSSYWEKNAKPVLDRMVAGGTLVEWGRSVAVVHTEEGATHSAWWSAATLGGTQRVLEELLKIPPNPAMTGARHRDYLLRSLVYRVRPGSASSGYFHLSYTEVRPGKGREWRELWDKYSKPTLEQLLADGTIAGYGLDVEHVHTRSTGGRYAWVFAANAEALDKVEAAFEAARGKLTPEANRGIAAAFAEATVPDAHRDSLERVIEYVHK